MIHNKFLLVYVSLASSKRINFTEQFFLAKDGYQKRERRITPPKVVEPAVDEASKTPTKGSKAVTRKVKKGQHIIVKMEDDGLNRDG